MDNAEESLNRENSTEVGNSEESLNYEFIPGKKVNSTLLYTVEEKQAYRLRSTYNDVQSYTCIISQCSVRVQIASGVCVKANKFVEHTHGTQEKLYHENKLRSEIKKQCGTASVLLSDPNVSVRSVFDNQCLT